MNLLYFIKTLNLMLRFSLELFALGSLAYWGFQTGKGSMRVLLTIGAPLIIAVVWGFLVLLVLTFNYLPYAYIA